MPKLTLYHGSINEIKKPIHGFGTSSNDYGRGFYCTESEEMAKEWACQNDCTGHSNRYSLETEGLSLLDLNSTPYNELNWIAILLRNKHPVLDSDMDVYRTEKIIEKYYVDTTQYDLVKGYRADDSYFQYATMFAQGRLSLEKLRLALRLGGFGTQIVLISEKAFDRIQYESSSPVDPNAYYSNYLERTQQACSAFSELTRYKGVKPEGTYIDSLLED
ncbi:MAG: DUF3990 domain-containing protein [archaeon]|nr:DUF3990 domain-containing protein [archaeon]